LLAITHSQERALGHRTQHMNEQSERPSHPHEPLSTESASAADGRALQLNPERVIAPRIPVWSYLERKTGKYSNRMRTGWREKTQPSEIRIRGVRIPIDRELYSPKIIQRLYDEGYEREERIALERSLRSSDRVLELGACIGYLSTVAARLIGSDKVTTCEANPALIPMIGRVHDCNDVRPTVLHGVMTLEAAESTCAFYSHRDIWSSSLLEPAKGDFERVAVPTLDWRSELQRLQPTYLLMDIEGGEIDLLESFDCASVERMLIEFHPRKTGQAGVDRVFRHLAKIGFARVHADRGTHIYYFER